MSKKILVLGLVALLVVCILSSYSIVSAEKVDFHSEITNQDTIVDNSGAATAATNITGALLNVFRVAAIGIALIMLVVVAVKYMSAAPEGKADIKKHAVIYIVGAIVLFASAAILTIIQNFAQANVNNAAGVT